MRYILYEFREENSQLADSFYHDYQMSYKFGDTHIIMSNCLDNKIIHKKLHTKTNKTIWLIPTVLKNSFDDILKDVFPNPRQQTSWRDYNPSDLNVDGQEEALKNILCKILENENLKTDSIIFSEILEVQEIKGGDQPDLEINPQSYPISILDRFEYKNTILIILFFISFVVFLREIFYDDKYKQAKLGVQQGKCEEEGFRNRFDEYLQNRIDIACQGMKKKGNLVAAGPMPQQKHQYLTIIANKRRKTWMRITDNTGSQDEFFLNEDNSYKRQLEGEPPFKLRVPQYDNISIIYLDKKMYLTEHPNVEKVPNKKIEFTISPNNN